jgi:hypothetical protein
MDKLILHKLNKVIITVHYQLEISKTFAAFENLSISGLESIEKNNNKEKGREL